MTPNNEATKSKIVDTSQKIQEVLLLLLSDNDDLRQRLDQEVADRKRETGELRDRLEKETGELKERLDTEIAERKVSGRFCVNSEFYFTSLKRPLPYIHHLSPWYLFICCLPSLPTYLRPPLLTPYPLLYSFLNFLC